MDSELSSTRRPLICNPTNPFPADAVILPADARGAFHLPPAASLLSSQQRHAVDIANAV